MECHQMQFGISGLDSPDLSCLKELDPIDQLLNLRWKKTSVPFQIQCLVTARLNIQMLLYPLLHRPLPPPQSHLPKVKKESRPQEMDFNGRRMVSQEVDPEEIVEEETNLQLLQIQDSVLLVYFLQEVMEIVGNLMQTQIYRLLLQVQEEMQRVLPIFLDCRDKQKGKGKTKMPINQWEESEEEVEGDQRTKKSLKVHLKSSMQEKLVVETQEVELVMSKSSLQVMVKLLVNLILHLQSL